MVFQSRSKGKGSPTPGADSTAQPKEKENVVQIDDRVQVQVDGDMRVRVVVLTSNRHEPDLGFISVKHPSGAALLGAEEDDEIEFEIDGKSRRWMVVKIDKNAAVFPAYGTGAQFI